MYALPIVRTDWYINSISRLHGLVAKGVGHLGHDEPMEARGCELEPRPGHCIVG